MGERSAGPEELDRNGDGAVVVPVSVLQQPLRSADEAAAGDGVLS